MFDVKGWNVYFHSESPLAHDLDLVRPVYDLPEILDMAKERGLYTIARFIAVKDGLFASRQKDTMIKNSLTAQVLEGEWVDPAHETVLEYNRQVLQEVVSAGIDEVNLDYIRYPTDYGQKAIGLTGEEKADRLEAFLRMARETIDEYGEGTKLGISTFAILAWDFDPNFEILGQDIERFAPLVDVISPMVYPATFSLSTKYFDPAKDSGSRMFNIVRKTLVGYRDLVGEEQERKIRPWLQGWGVTEVGMRNQIAAVYDAGMCGFTVWNADNAYGPLYEALEGIEVPEHCLDRLL